MAVTGEAESWRVAEALKSILSISSPLALLHVSVIFAVARSSRDAHRDRCSNHVSGITLPPYLAYFIARWVEWPQAWQIQT